MKNAAAQQTRLAIFAPLAVAAVIAVFITSDALAGKPGGGTSPTYTRFGLGVRPVEAEFYAGLSALSPAGTVVGTYEPAALVFGVRRHIMVPEDTNGNGRPDRWFRDSNGDGVNDLFIDLGVPPRYATVDPEWIEVAAYDINAGGQVLLRFVLCIDLGDYNWEFVDSAAYLLTPKDVNGDGKLAWFAPDAAGDNSLVARVGPWPADSAACVEPAAINNVGQIVGLGDAGGFLVNPIDADGDGVAVTWFRDANGAGINDLMVDLGVALPTDINDADWVIGSSPRPWVLIPRRDPNTGRQIRNEDANGDGVNDRVITLPLSSSNGGMWPARLTRTVSLSAVAQGSKRDGTVGMRSCGGWMHKAGFQSRRWDLGVRRRMASTPASRSSAATANRLSSGRMGL